jgi:hypothetical protein
MISEIIVIDPIKHEGAVGFLSNRSQMTMQLSLAGIATVLRVTGVTRILKLKGGDLLVPHPKPGHLLARFQQEMGSEGGRNARNR